MINLAFIMDVSILVLLAATVFLAFRLNVNLRNFKESRFEMEGLVNRLTSNIDKAEKAIGGLQNAARNSGKELDEVISDAKPLADELRFMTEAGNILANRLEKLAERNREMVDKIENAGGIGHGTQITYKEPLPKGTHTQVATPKAAKVEDDAPRGFMIQDRDYGDDADDDVFNDEFISAESSGLQSQAERELFEALQKNKRKGVAGRA